MTLAEKAVRQSQADGDERSVPPETAAETTMELLVPEELPEEVPEEPAGAAQAAEAPAAGDPYAIGPDRHERVPDADARVPDQPEEPVTDKGLPKRTPKITAAAPATRQRSGSVDAEALRRRLGGFRRGAEAGYRDVEAEIAEQTGQNQVPVRDTAGSEEATGGTVEEASS